MREIITFACVDCKRKNYTSMKNKKKHPDRMEVKKYCPFCKKHTSHKEAR